MKKYILTTTTYHTEKELDFYGIALIEQDDSNSYELIKAFNDLTQDKASVENLIDNCNKLVLEEIHFEDVVEDLVSF